MPKDPCHQRRPREGRRVAAVSRLRVRNLERAAEDARAAYAARMRERAEHRERLVRARAEIAQAQEQVRGSRGSRVGAELLEDLAALEARDRELAEQIESARVASQASATLLERVQRWLREQGLGEGQLRRPVEPSPAQEALAHG